MMFTEKCSNIFKQAITDYHVKDQVDQVMENPYLDSSIDYMLYTKSWIDNLQWHLEDLIRDPYIDPTKALKIKRKLDEYNQKRTDTVELIDNYFLAKYQRIPPCSPIPINTESPAWAIDRLAILALKIYHMEEETKREEADQEHRYSCQKKLDILLIQQKDLQQAIENLLTDIASGKKQMKVYRQMKMYNDPTLNPVLYKHKH